MAFLWPLPVLLPLTVDCNTLTLLMDSACLRTSPYEGRNTRHGTFRGLPLPFRRREASLGSQWTFISRSRVRTDCGLYDIISGCGSGGGGFSKSESRRDNRGSGLRGNAATFSVKGI